MKEGDWEGKQGARMCLDAGRNWEGRELKAAMGRKVGEVEKRRKRRK